MSIFTNELAILVLCSVAPLGLRFVLSFETGVNTPACGLYTPSGFMGRLFVRLADILACFLCTPSGLMGRLFVRLLPLGSLRAGRRYSQPAWWNSFFLA